jgi:diguanylate cyclase
MNKPQKDFPENSSPDPDGRTATAPDGHAIAAESWWRTQSATMALLKHAYTRMDEAEKTIADQERRIRQLERLASTDPLTELMNRRGFEKFFEHELARIRRHNNTEALLVLIDLDRFKIINDTFGHRAGDACLRMVAEELTRSVRTLDGAARFGGDEFALLLTQTDPEKATLRVQKLRDRLNSLTLDWQGSKVRFGASAGIEIVTSASEFGSAYEAADTNLYADKQNRRQRAKA